MDERTYTEDEVNAISELLLENQRLREQLRNTSIWRILKARWNHMCNQ
jgi:hypothetical protein